jgi:hypothetical protein
MAATVPADVITCPSGTVATGPASGRIRVTTARNLALAVAGVAAFATAGAAIAGGPTAAAQHHPKNHVAATAVCRDGTLTDNTTKSACKNHGGVAHWIKRRHTG